MLITNNKTPPTDWVRTMSRFRSDLDKISQTGAEWHVDCGDMVKIETTTRILIWRRTFGRIQCHDPRAVCHIASCSYLTKSMSCSCHIAGCKNSIRHIENRFSAILIFCFVFLMQFGLWQAAAIVSSPTHLLVLFSLLGNCKHQYASIRRGLALNGRVLWWVKGRLSGCVILCKYRELRVLGGCIR